MTGRRLQSRFILAGCLLIVATVGSSLGSALTFLRLNTAVDNTLRERQETVDLGAELQSSLEREDDALLLFLSGEVEQARRDLDAERRRGDGSFARLQSRLREGADDERSFAVTVRQEIDRYRSAGDELLSLADRTRGLEQYHRHVNPLLRRAVAGCDALREANFRSMKQAGVQARDEAARGTRLVTAISVLTVAAGIAVAVWLARSVLGPVRELTDSVEEIRRGNFDRRVKNLSADELGELATGFNRMAEALSEYRRSSLGELITAKTTLEATLDALPDAVLVFAPDGALEALNPPARLVLAARQAGAARRLSEISFSDDERAAVEAALAGRSPGTRPLDFTQMFSGVVEGQLRKYRLTAVPVSAFVPGRFGAVVVLDDMTEFARLDELRSELIGVASHELKSPLTTLKMNLLMLGEGADRMSPRQKELAAAANDACEELGLTIEELLDVTRIEAGQLRLNLAPSGLGSLLETVRQSMQARFDDAGVRFQIENELESDVVRGDPARLRSVLANVLGNALKYSPHGGVVTVRLSPGPVSAGTVSSGAVPSRQNALPGSGPPVQIAVTDQGTGVPEAFCERIFEKFFRVEHSLGHGGEGVRGTGIGLYLCREIVKAHGGTIACGPGEEGRGTRIAISLSR